MEILVCVKQVPAASTVEVDEATGVLKREGSGGKINPYDLYALEEAFRLKETFGGRVSVLSMGPPQAEAALKEALYMGADRAFLLCDRRFAGADVLATSRALAAGVRKTGPYHLLLCGKQTTDGDTAQVGPELAELLDIPHACCVSALQADDSGVEVCTGYGAYELVQRMPLPCLVTVEKGINTPRLPSYRRRLETAPEQVTVMGMDDLDEADEARYGLSGSPTQVERIFPPEHSIERVTLQGPAPEVAGQLYAVLAGGKFL